jgi:transcriptional regulator with XRE-family HTH domain
MIKASDLKTAAQVEEEARDNPEVRRELDRTALANAVAIRIIGYRARHGLSQTQLARQLGMHQSAIARLEAGDHEPSLSTLARLARQLGIAFDILITPEAVETQFVEVPDAAADLTGAPAQADNRITALIIEGWGSFDAAPDFIQSIAGYDMEEQVRYDLIAGYLSRDPAQIARARLREEADYMIPSQPINITDLINVFGSDFTAYVLNLDGAENLEQRLVDLLPGQLASLQLLQQIRRPYRPEDGTPEGAIWASRVNADQYMSEQGSSLANLLRVLSGGTILPTRTDTDPILNALFAMLTDAYPALLLPQEPIWATAPISRVTFNHPMRADLESAILADPALSKLYSEELPQTGKTGMVYRSTGQGGGVQLIIFSSQQISMAYTWACLESRRPTIDEVADKLVLSLSTIRRAIMGKPVTVPMRLGLAGILLPEGLDQLDLGWATLKRATDEDRRVADQAGVSGKLQTTQPDGSVVVIDYAGDVVLSLDVPYKISIKEFKLSNGWPPELMSAMASAAQDVESLRLALALAVEDSQPALVVQSSQLTIDPLAHAALPGWSDTRRTPNLIPRQLTQEQTAVWGDWCQRVRGNRTPRTSLWIP